MWRRAAARLFAAAITLWVVVSATFLLHHALPDDPARSIAGPQARASDVARIRRQLGLDRPLYVQYGIFARRLVHVSSRADGGHASCGRAGFLHLDLGTSYQHGRPVVRMIAERLPYSVLLAVAAVFVEIAIGLGLGLVAAMKKQSLWDTGAVALSLFGMSMPTFLVGIGLQWLLAHRLGLLPLDGAGKGLSGALLGVVLPAVTLGVFGAAFYTRLVRDQLLSALGQDFVRTARAKGAGAPTVLRHALRNAVIPLVTAIGLDLGALLGGAIVTEKLFRWPGLGQLSVDAVFERDAPVVMGTVLVASAAVVLANLTVDASYALLDPRTRRR